jgi:putative spermidine/putrescine transport system substrate-binding protein/spermidine/putrescine transport system substrate-binding protein
MADQIVGPDRIKEMAKLDPSEVMELYRAGKINRRDIFKVIGALGLTSFGMNMMDRGALAADDLKIIIWEGYADDKYKLPFETANGATITPTAAATGDEMFSLMDGSGGANFDGVSASSDLPQRLYDKGLLAEIDPTKLTNYNKLWDQFKSPPYITFDNKLYGVNFAWGPTIAIYSPEAYPTAPTSWKALTDEANKGKIATWNYPLQIAQYALLLDPVPADPYELSDEQLAQVKDILLAQRPLVRKYWDFGQEVSELFLNKEIVIADGWSWITLQTRAGGLDVQEAVPAEGVTGWSDSWCISAKSENYDLALKWADWMIGDEGQIGITEVMNYSITNKEAAATLTPERQAELRLTDVAAEYAKIHMWRFIPAYNEKWVPLWNEATIG